MKLHRTECSFILGNVVVRIIGRLQYFIRMMGFAVVSHFAYCYYEGIPIWHQTSVMWPLTLSVLLINIGKSDKLPTPFKILPIILLILGSILSDWGVLALIMPAVLYKCRHSFRLQSCSIFISGVLAALLTQAPLPYRILQMFVVLSIPILANYNNERGEGSKMFFYIYYPLHLVMLKTECQQFFNSSSRKIAIEGIFQ